MQNFTDIPSTRTLSDSLAEILNNDKTAISCSSGTAFPTANLQLGMLCFRTDQNKLYILKATSPSAVWVEIMDVTASSGKAPNAEAVDGIDGAAVLLKASNLSDLANAATARSNLGIGDVENKSSATIRSEITSGNVTGALGYTPVNNAGDTMSGTLVVPYLNITRQGNADVLYFVGADRGWMIRQPAGGGMAFWDNFIGADRLKIDDQGRVTMPYQPMFRCRGSGGAYEQAAGQITAISQILENVGGNYSSSTHRFTAPTAGKYLFWVNLFGVGGSDRIGYAINGNNQSSPYIVQTFDNAVSGSIIVHLNANDYLTIFAQYGGSSIYLDHCGWGGYLLG